MIVMGLLHIKKRGKIRYFDFLKLLKNNKSKSMGMQDMLMFNQGKIAVKCLKIDSLTGRKEFSYAR
jgi:hypothetical protein